MTLATGKVVLVTGAARGMGAAEAGWLAREGADVVLADVLDELGAEAAGQIRRDGGSAEYVSLDVTEESQWKDVVGQIIDRHGRIDALVNNAGVMLRKGVLDVDLADFDRVMQVNLTGPLLGIRAVAPHMIASGGGAIVNIVSGAAMAASPNSAYAASKWALRGLTKSVALELGSQGVRVNAVHPGGIRTDMAGDDTALAAIFSSLTPLGRLGTPDDVAAIAGFLCTDSAAFITGADIVVDGGFVDGAPMGGFRLLATAKS